MEPFEANGHWTVDTYSKFCCSEIIFLLFYTHKIELYYCSIGNFNRCTQGFQKPIIRTLSKCSSKNSCIIQYYFKFNDRKILVCNVCPKYHASNNSLLYPCYTNRFVLYDQTHTKNKAYSKQQRERPIRRQDRVYWSRQMKRHL